MVPVLRLHWNKGHWRALVSFALKGGQASAADLVAEDGKIFVAGTDRSITFREVARAVYAEMGRLPPDARGQVIQDFGRFHLRRPPRGYYWYQAGSDYVLASLATGVIFEVFPSDDF